MPINVGNLGSPSSSRNSRLTEGVWHSFNGRDYTCKIGGIVYDWQKTVGDFIGAQSPTPTFDRASYQIDEITFLNATTVGELTQTTAPDVSTPLFNANWQDGNGAMISWVSNENNTGVSDDTRVLIGDSIYDLGKPILGAALSSGFILAIHCDNGIASLVEYKISGNSAIETKNIPIEATGLIDPDARVNNLSPLDWFLAYGGNPDSEIYAALEAGRDVSHTGIYANMMSHYSTQYADYNQADDIVYFASKARASFSSDLTRFLLHANITRTQRGAVLSSGRNPYHKSYSNNAQDTFRESEAKLVNCFVVFNLQVEKQSDIEGSVIAYNITPYTIKKFLNYPLPQQQLEYVVFDSYGNESPDPLVGSHFSTRKQKSNEVNSTYLLFAEIVKNEPMWVEASVNSYIDCCVRMYDLNLRNTNVLGTLQWRRKSFNSNQDATMFVGMGATKTTGTSNSIITLRKRTFVSNKIIGTKSIQSELRELRFSNGDFQYNYDITQGSQNFGTYGAYGVPVANYALDDSIDVFTDKGKLIATDGELITPIIEVDYVDLRCDFASISIIEYDCHYMFYPDIKYMKRHVFYLDNSVNSNDSFYFGTLNKTENPKEKDYELLESYKTIAGLKSVFYLPNSVMPQVFADINVDNIIKYYFPAENPLLTSKYTRREPHNKMFRQSSCAYNAEEKTFVYYINGGYCGVFDGTEHIKIESSYIDNHQVDFYYMKLS